MDPDPARARRRLPTQGFCQRSWYPALKALGLDPRGPHALRHTFVRWGTDRGVYGHTLSALTGQKNLAVTMGYGQGTNLSNLVKDANRIAGILFNEETNIVDKDPHIGSFAASLAATYMTN